MKTLLLSWLAIVTSVVFIGCSSIDTTGNNNAQRLPSQAGVAGGSGAGSGGGVSNMPKHIP